ncbi:hypothetical protein N9L68_01940 [bacterium]|nr:hypothetical protein [bacterium]
MVSKRPRGRIIGSKTPSRMNSWFQNALAEEELVPTPSRKNSWFQNALVEE